MDWESAIKMGGFMIVVISTIVGGLYKFWQYATERKERLLDSDFEKLDKLISDGAFKEKMKDNPLLKSLYYKNIKYFSGIKSEVIDVILKSQNNQDRNFNTNFYQINKLYKNNLININEKSDDFYINKVKIEKICYSKKFVWFLWIMFAFYCIFLSVIFAFLKLPTDIAASTVGILLMSFVQIALMNHHGLVADLEKFKKKYE